MNNLSSIFKDFVDVIKPTTVLYKFAEGVIERVNTEGECIEVFFKDDSCSEEIQISKPDDFKIGMKYVKVEFIYDKVEPKYPGIYDKVEPKYPGDLLKN